MPLSEAEELELLELEELESGGGAPAAQAPDLESPTAAPEMQEPFAKRNPLANKIRAALGTDTDSEYFPSEVSSAPRKPVEMTVADNPLLSWSGAGTTAAVGAASKSLPVMSHIAQKFATHPGPAALEKATNVTGAVKGLMGKASDLFQRAVPENLKPVADFVTGVAGRHAAYSNPVTGFSQGVSDVAKVTKGAQSVVAKLLDSAPARLGKFAPILQQAATRGGQALATTDFLLQQTDPEYQQVKKGLEE